MLVYLFSLLSIWVASQALQYHLESTLSLSTSNARRISMVEDKLVVEMSSFQFAMLNGTNFTNIVYQAQIPNQRDPRFTASNYYLCYLNILYAYQFRNYKQYDTYDIDGANAALITPNYSLFSFSRNCAQISRLDLETGVVDILTLESGPDCTDNGYGNFSNPHRKVIFFAISSSLYVLDNSTLEVKQRLAFTNIFGSFLKINKIDSIYDAKADRIVVQAHSYSSVKKYFYDTSKEKLLELAQFYNPSYNLTLLDSRQAVSFRFREVKSNIFNYWKDYEHLILAINTNGTDERMINRKNCALSNKEDIFVLTDNIFNGQADNLYLNNLTKSLQIVSLFQVSLPNLKEYSYLNAKFTTNDQFLIAMQSNPTNRMGKITIVNTITHQLAVLNSSSIIGFTLPVAQDRIIILSSEPVNSSQYYLKLYKISDLSLIFKSPALSIISGFNIGQLRLASNGLWGNKFILYFNNDTGQRVELYQYLKDTLVNTGKYVNLIINSPTLHVCNKYFIIRSQGMLSVYNSQDLQKLKDISLQFHYFGNFVSEKDMMVIEDHYYISYEGVTDNSGTIVFDFSKEENQWFQGTIYKQYENQALSPGLSNCMLFSNRKLYYYFRNRNQELSDPVKVIYDLSMMPIRSQYTINSGRANANNVQSFVAVPIPTDISNCSFIFFTQPYSRQLHRYNTCLSDQGQIFQLASFPADCLFYDGKSLLTSTGQHIVVMMKGFASGGIPYFRAEIRSIENPNFVLYNYEDRYRNLRAFWPTLDVDSKNHVLILNQLVANVIDQPTAERIESYGFNFEVFDVNSRFLIFSGQSLTNRTQWIIVSKLVSSNFESFRTNLSVKVEVLAISQDGSTISAFANSTVFVWQAAKASLIYSCQRSKVIALKFMKNSHLVLKFNNSFEVVSLTAIKRLFFARDAAINTYYDVAVSPNGQLIAHIASDQQAAIYNYEGELISNFFVEPGQKISCLTFAPNNSLLVATSGIPSTLFTLSSSPCPASFFNENSLCVCSGNATLQANTCECKQNFVSDPKNTTCSCPSSLEFKNGYCNACRGNMTIVDYTCQCKLSYIFNSERLSCECPASSSYENDQCICLNGYIASSTCNECSFLCTGGCTSSFLSCNSFSAVFYIIIAGCGCVVVAVVIFVACKAKRRKHKGNSNITKETMQEKWVEETPLTKENK